MRDAEGVRVIGLPRNNDPRAQAASEQEWDRLVREGAQGFTLRLTFPGYRQRAASLGWLRAGFLVAFAALGYGYIFSRPLEIVREQLADPTAQLLEAWSVTAPAAEPSERRLLVVEQPSELRSLAVQMGRHVVFLPTPVGADADLYDRLARDQSRAGGGRVQATLKR